MAFAPEFQTLEYEERDGVAFVTLEPTRPVYNAFNSLMQRELKALWRGLRRHDDVRCIVLTGAGDKAFCTGIDRMEQMGGDTEATSHRRLRCRRLRFDARSCSTIRATTSARRAATCGSR